MGNIGSHLGITSGSEDSETPETPVFSDAITRRWGIIEGEEAPGH
jgi:hypothetical protein